MHTWKFLWRIVGQLIIILGIVGMIAAHDWLSHLDFEMPEQLVQMLFLYSIVYMSCILVSVIGIFILGGWFWQRYPEVIRMYVFAFLAGFIAMSLGYLGRNDSVPESALSAIGMSAVIFTFLTILTSNHKTTGSTNNNKTAFVITAMTLFLVSSAGFIFPQWFDAATKNFPDHSLRVVVRESAGRQFGFVTTSDFEKITGIDAFDRGVTDLTGIGECKNLQFLELGGNWPLEDVTQLKDLHSLVRLGLAFDGVWDISPLSGLTKLTHLYMFSNQELEDISPLVSLTNLSVLNLGANDIRDIRPLETLTNLTDLDLEQNKISDISSLRELTNLAVLDLRNNKITDISPLLENTGLGKGDKVELESNPLNEASINVYIPQLQKRGVEVDW